MRGYSIISNEERAQILNTHRSFYDGYATGNVPNPQQPLTVEDLAQDKNGLQVMSNGEIGQYNNHIHEQVAIDAPDMDVSDVDPAYDFISQGPEGGETVEEKEMCEQCGSEMVEGECMECGMYESIDEDLYESFKSQREQILETFNKFKKYN
jgi:hypothetical protein